MGNWLTPKDNSANPAPREVYNWRIYALALAASMGSSMFGYDSAFIGGALTLPAFQKRFGLATAKGNKLAALKANIVSTFQAGCFFGAILCYPITERFGRRLSLMLCGIIFNIGAILQVAAHGQLGLIYAGRVFTGLAVGSSSMLVPIYISECSPPAIRGRLIGIFEVILQISLVIGFWVNYGVNIHIPKTSDNQWRVPFAIQFVPATFLIIFMFFQPESPRWLVNAGRSEEATRSLARIRSLPEDHEYIQWEINNVKEQIEHEKNIIGNKNLWGKLKECFMPQNRSRLLIGMALMILQNLSGINALNYYAPSIFTSIGFKGTNVGLLATGVFGIVKMLATLFFMMFGIDKLGRRRSLMIGTVGAMVAMYYLAGFSKLSNSFGGHAKKDGGAYVAIVMVYIFSVFYAMSWNGIPWIFCAEVFPVAIRSVCLVFTTCAQWLGQFMIVYSTPYMMANITYGTFLFFGSSLVVGFVFAWFFVPETKGLSLEEMDILFETPGTASTKRRKTDAIIAERRAEVGHHSNYSGSEKEVVLQDEKV